MKKVKIIFVLLVLIFIGAEKSAFAVDLTPPPEIIMKNCCNYTEVRASHILVKTKEEAIKIRKEILAGKSFEQAAKEYSFCPSGQEGGDLGYFNRGMMVPPFEEAAFSLPVGQLSVPVETEFGWHLILVKDKR